MASEKSKAGGKRVSRRLTDAFVMTAMALVTLALCVGLIVQSGLGLWLSATVSLSFYVGLLTLHTIVRRTGQMDQMRAEIDSLRAELGRVHGVAPDAAAAPTVAVPAPTVAAGARAVDPANAPAGHATRPTSDTGKAATPAAASAPTAPAMPSQTAARGQPTLQVGPPLGAPAPVASAPPAQTPASAPVAGAGREVRPEAPPTTAPAPAAGDFTARMQRAIRAPVAPPPPPPARQHVAIPSSAPVRAPVASQPPHDGSAAAERGHAMMPPPAVPVAAPPSPREADVEMIQGLIRKLADEVDSAAVDRLGPPLGDPIDKALAIEASVGALKRAAETMKAPADYAGLGAVIPGLDGIGSGQDQASAPAGVDQDKVDTMPLGFRRSRASTPPPVPAPRAASGEPAPSPAAEAVPAQVEPEFDVEKLMQRAQSIAAMTSVPPPLEMAAMPDADANEGPAAASDDARRLAHAAEALEREGLAGRHVSAEERAFEPQRGAEAAVQTATPAPQLQRQPSADELEAAERTRVERRLQRVAGALEAGRVEVLLEPILDIAQQQAAHYEVTVCLRDADGSEIGGASDSDGVGPALPLLDSVRLSRTAQVARLLEERRKAGSVFSTFSGRSLDSDEFLAAFADTYESQEGLARQLVLTFAQSDVRGFRGPQWDMLDEMRELGFRFALRAVTDLDLDFEALAQVGFAFVKLDADVFLEGLPAPGAVLPAADICKHLGGFGLALVVEHIDDEAKRARIQSTGVAFGQGRLFGGARLVKASALAAVGRPAAA